MTRCTSGAWRTLSASGLTKPSSSTGAARAGGSVCWRSLAAPSLPPKGACCHTKRAVTRPNSRLNTPSDSLGCQLPWSHRETPWPATGAFSSNLDVRKGPIKHEWFKARGGCHT